VSRRALELFEESLDWEDGLGPDAIRARLRERCGGDAGLLAAVQRLIEADRNATRTISSTARQPHQIAGAPPTPPPERIGPWHLTDVLGVGGMGSVYRGERDDGLFEQVVAIKLVRPGLWSATTAERFVQERRTLARLKHPNIALLLDGGSDAAGQAWLAMEYVEGVPITEWAAGRTLAARLEVFERACEAVQFAHQNLVVHADLKPSNILVTRAGVPKLLDFGIAEGAGHDRPAADRAAGESHVPQQAAPLRPMTPACAAPELLAGGRPSVSSDVYALGVLLGELCDGAVERRSPDLLAIIAKARAPTPAARYATVAALAEDLARLRRHLPILARPHDWRYLTRCFLRRHRSGAIASGLALAALVGAVALTTTLYIRAERARLEADTRFGEVRELSRYMLFDLYDQLTRLPGATAAREQLADKAGRYLERLAAQPRSPFDLRFETAVGFARLASLRGVPAMPNLGDPQAARAELERARSTLEALHREAPARRDVATELAATLLLQARMAEWIDQTYDAARPLVARAGELLDASDVNAGTPLREYETRLLHLLVAAEIEDWASEPARVVVLMQRALASLDAWPAALRAEQAYATGRARALLKLGDGLYYTDRRAEALARYREADALLEDADRRMPNRPEILSLRTVSGWGVASTLTDAGRTREALPQFDATLAVLGQLERFEKADVALARQREVLEAARADALSLLGRHDEAIATHEAVLQSRLERSRAAPGNVGASRDVAYQRLALGKAYENARQHARACETWRAGAEGFAALERAGTLSTSDRGDHMAKLRTLLATCATTSQRE
jgi:serine/threonine-protein kinase